MCIAGHRLTNSVEALELYFNIAFIPRREIFLDWRKWWWWGWKGWGQPCHTHEFSAWSRSSSKHLICINGYLLDLQQYVVVVQLLICVWLLATPWTAACQASLSFTISWSLLKLMSIESVMPSNHLILCCPLLLLSSIFPSIGAFSNGGQSIGASASPSVLPMNIQGWFSLT